ncbi:hypothetical protein DBR06_SOUSAS15410008, partial [Sousa chinensis]
KKFIKHFLHHSHAETDHAEKI